MEKGWKDGRKAVTSGQWVVISKGNLDIAVRTRMGQGFTVGILSHSLSTRLIFRCLLS